MAGIKSVPEGLILINKPSGITSHDVVDVVRKSSHIPFASLQMVSALAGAIQ